MKLRNRKRVPLNDLPTSLFFFFSLLSEHYSQLAINFIFCVCACGAITHITTIRSTETLITIWTRKENVSNLTLLARLYFRPSAPF